MPTRKSPRKGSLQFWPRKRARKILPRVNWSSISHSKPLKGFICYKAGMKSVLVKDNTEHSMTKGKNIAIPATILECPSLKILSVRFYKKNIPVKDVIVDNSEKNLKGKLKLPKTTGKIEDFSSKTEEYDDISVVVYSQVKKTGLKKTPDIIELGLNGSLEEKLNFVKENSVKEITILDFFNKGELVDLRGLTRGRGLQGPVKRFGITLKSHKSEKGRRRPGSLGPWHPARVTFRAPQAGQVGFQTRVIYNNKILDMGKVEGSNLNLKGIKNYGDLKTNYLIVAGSVQGPSKRQLILTAPLRTTKRQSKKNYEVIELK